MNSVTGILKGMGVLVVIVAIGVTIGVLSGSKDGKKGANQASVQVTNVAEQPAPEPKTAQPVAVVPAPASTTNPVQVTTQEAPAPVASNIITNWESRLDDILGSDIEEKDKAIKMAELLPNLPEEGQMEVAQHLSNLVTDEDYATISGFLANGTLPESVLDVFLADSLNRPNGEKLPLLLEVAQNEKHPKAGEAKEILQLYLEEDYGTDWTTWKTKVDEWLKNNPDN